MTVKELIEKLKTVDPDMEVVVLDESGSYNNEYYEYPIDEKDIDLSFGKFSIGVG